MCDNHQAHQIIDSIVEEFKDSDIEPLKDLSVFCTDQEPSDDLVFHLLNTVELIEDNHYNDSIVLWSYAKQLEEALEEKDEKFLIQGQVL
jgi:hypothetical protein